MAINSSTKTFLVKTAVFTALGVGGFFLIRWALKSAGITKSKGEKAAEGTYYDYVATGNPGTVNTSASTATTTTGAANSGPAPTISEATAKNLANKIKNAWGVFNDDEDAVYSALQQLKTIADLNLVILKYGIYKDEDLPQAIQSRMNNSEIAKCNTILASRGINFSF